jgi:L-aminopeptidase/D-esterase-like protein
MNGMHNHSITDVPGIKVGHATDATALTGCTVILAEAGAVAGVDVRGSAPGTRETDLLKPMNLVEKAHGVVLSGGSAFGLDAASGVMGYLESQKIGFDTGVAFVPIVPAAVLFDLCVGDATIRPDAAMGIRACQAASSGPVAEGNVGAGTGATVGKYLGMDYAMKGGVGTSSLAMGDRIMVGAIAAVNAWGDVYDQSGRIIAGVRDPQTDLPAGAVSMMKANGAVAGCGFTNTTLAVVATNMKLTKETACKVAQMAHDGMARAISPVHTMVDGDVVFVLSTGNEAGDLNTLGTLAAEVVAEAIRRGVLQADSIPGIPAARDR